MARGSLVCAVMGALALGAAAQFGAPVGAGEIPGAAAMFPTSGGGGAGFGAAAAPAGFGAAPAGFGAAPAGFGAAPAGFGAAAAADPMYAALAGLSAPAAAAPAGYGAGAGAGAGFPASAGAAGFPAAAGAAGYGAGAAAQAPPPPPGANAVNLFVDNETGGNWNRTYVVGESPPPTENDLLVKLIVTNPMEELGPVSEGLRQVVSRTAGAWANTVEWFDAKPAPAGSDAPPGSTELTLLFHNRGPVDKSRQAQQLVNKDMIAGLMRATAAGGVNVIPGSVKSAYAVQPAAKGPAAGGLAGLTGGEFDKLYQQLNAPPPAPPAPVNATNATEPEPAAEKSGAGGLGSAAVAAAAFAAAAAAAVALF